MLQTIAAAHAMAAWSRVPTYRALREAVPAVAFSSLDDPLDLDVAPVDGDRVSLAVVTLRRVDGQTLRWVP